MSGRAGKALSAPFGRIVRQRREELGISQDEFMRISGVHRTYISHVERGLRSPTLEVMVKIARALQTTADELLSQLTEEDLERLPPPRTEEQLQADAQKRQQARRAARGTAPETTYELQSEGSEGSASQERAQPRPGMRSGPTPGAPTEVSDQT